MQTMNVEIEVHYRIAMGMSAALIATAMACVDDSTMTPNSDEGHLFIDLQKPLAAGWESEVLIMGPSTGGEHCDDDRGCYADHMPLTMEEIRSTDASVVEVKGFGSEDYGEVEVIRVDLEMMQEGEASLEFEFDVDGDYEPNSQQEDDPDDNTEDDSEWIEDSFGIEVREVSSVRLARILDDVEPTGPYGQCPESALGTYVMGHIDEYTVSLRFQKLDSEGNVLRGTGAFPFEKQPEEAVAIEEIDEAHHLVQMRPKEFGTVTLEPTMPGSPFRAHFVARGDIQDMDVSLRLLLEDGSRGAEAMVLGVDHFYEVDARPRVPEGGPLCGGAVQTSARSLTPAICEVRGEVMDSGNPALLASQIGECHLEITLHGAGGGQGLVRQMVYGVEPTW